MNIKGYETFSEWKKDYSKYLENPEDKHLEKSINRKFSNTDRKIQRKIDLYLQNMVLETNLTYVLNKVLEEVGPNYIPIVKTRQDPWFDC